MRRRHLSIAAIVLGVVMLGGAAGFRAFAAPALVRFPLNVDETTHYTGTALTYVDSATLLPLSTPKREPLTIDRHVKVVSGTFDRAVVDETVTVKSPSTSTVETYQYVIDRRSMQMVSDPRQYAFGDPKATMHAAGAYRVNFSMGTTADGSYRAFIPEIDSTAPLVLFHDSHDHSDAHIPVIDFTTKNERQVAPYYLNHLKAMGLPMQVTAAQLQPLLQADGIDVSRALADVGPHLTPAESTLVSQTLAKSVPLHYFFIDNGLVSIEPRTGALIDVHAQEQGIAVQPDLSGAATLQPLFDKYAAIPSVKALSDGLAALAKQPPQLAENFKYTQTIPSSLHAASVARKNVRMKNMAEVRVPWTLAVIGFILLVLGLIGWRGSRRTRAGAGGPTQTSVATEPAEPTTEATVTIDEVVTEEPVAEEPVSAPAVRGRAHEGV